MEKSSRRWYRSSAAVTAGAVVASWFVTTIGPLSILMPVIVGGGLFVLLRRRHFLMAALLLGLMPTGVVAALTVGRYARGQATLVYPGLPGTETHNLDPELRCQRASSGCLVSGNEWAFQGTNNLIVSSLIRRVGPVRGSYLGPYPTQEVASAALASGKPVAVEALKADRVILGDLSITLDEGVGRELVTRLYDRPFLGSDERREPISAAIFQEECMILRIPTPAYSEDNERSGVVILISRSAGRPFAYYGEGTYYHHFPPVTWKAK